MRNSPAAVYTMAGFLPPVTDECVLDAFDATGGDARPA